MPYAVVAAVGAIGGALISSQGAQSAASTQAGAALQAQQMQQQTLQQQLAASQPYRQAGQQALGQLQTGLQPGGQFAQPFTLEQAKLSPTEQAVQAQSLEAMRNQMQLGGQNLSANAITGAGTLAGNIAGQYQNQAFNQWLAQQQQQMGGLESLAGLGIQQTGTAQQAMGVAGQNIGSLQVGIGNAQAAGQMAQANALAQGLGTAANTYQQMQMMNQILGQNQSTSPSVGSTWATPTGTITQTPTGTDFTPTTTSP